MTKDEVRLTYRLSKELYDRIEASAKKKHISVNAKITGFCMNIMNTTSRTEGGENRK